MKFKFDKNIFPKAQLMLATFFSLSIIFLDNVYPSQNFKLPKLFLVQIMPFDNSSYTVSDEFEDIKQSFNMGVEEFRKENKTCHFTEEIVLKHGNDEELAAKILEISQIDSEKMAIGFSRSSSALLSAKISSGTNLRGLSIGASTEQLQNINKNFMTIASPQSSQWSSIHNKINELGCNTGTTLGIFDLKDSYSSAFHEMFKADNFKNSLNFNQDDVISKIENASKNMKCLFLGMNISSSQSILERLLKTNWDGSIFGTGDWYYYQGELNKVIQNNSTFLKGQHRRNKLYFPTGWVHDLNENSQKFTSKFIKRRGKNPEPISAYTFDATILSLNHLCKNLDLATLNSTELKKYNLLREYKEISKSGNFLSNIILIER